mgnify:FL=1
MYYQRRILYQRILNENAIMAHNNQTYRKIQSFEHIRQHHVRQTVTPNRLFSLPFQSSHKACFAA